MKNKKFYVLNFLIHKYAYDLSKRRPCCTIILLLTCLCLPIPLHAADYKKSVFSDYTKESQDAVIQDYQEYQKRFNGISNQTDIAASGFRMIEDQVFPVTLKAFGEVSFIPALDEQYNRLALFFAKEDGSIVYKTDLLETNNQIKGELKQPNHGIAAVSFQDMDGDGLTDIVLITLCDKERKKSSLPSGSGAGQTYKVGDVLFQNTYGFYRDWRLSDKINRYSMNKSVGFITSFIRDGYSTEFLYTATSWEELEEHGFQITEECYWRKFEKMGSLLLVPGTYRMAEYSVFMVYLVNEQGYIVWSFQPMGDYESYFALKGITCKDIDGDGLKDIVVLGRYSYEGEGGASIVENDYSIYYQRTSGFYEEAPRSAQSGDGADTNFKDQYRCSDSDSLEEIVKKARAYWGWKTEND